MNNKRSNNNKLSPRAHARAYVKGENFTSSSVPELANEIYHWLLRVGLVGGIEGEDTICPISGIPNFTLINELEIEDLKELVAAAVNEVV